MPRRAPRKRYSHSAFLKARRAYYQQHWRKHPEKLAKLKRQQKAWARENYRMRKRQKYEREHACARCGHAREHTNTYGHGPCSFGRSIEEQLSASADERLFDKSYLARLDAMACPCPAHISRLPQNVTLAVKRVPRRSKGR